MSFTDTLERRSDVHIFRTEFFRGKAGHGFRRIPREEDVEDALDDQWRASGHTWIDSRSTPPAEEFSIGEKPGCPRSSWGPAGNESVPFSPDPQTPLWSGIRKIPLR